MMTGVHGGEGETRERREGTDRVCVRVPVLPGCRSCQGRGTSRVPRSERSRGRGRGEGGRGRRLGRAQSWLAREGAPAWAGQGGCEARTSRSRQRAEPGGCSSLSEGEPARETGGSARRTTWPGHPRRMLAAGALQNLHGSRLFLLVCLSLPVDSREADCPVVGWGRRVPLSRPFPPLVLLSLSPHPLSLSPALTRPAPPRSLSATDHQLHLHVSIPLPNPLPRAPPRSALFPAPCSPLLLPLASQDCWVHWFDSRRLVRSNFPWHSHATREPVC